nr:anthocyanidin 3-O-glucoside 2'''-O-xylosyltransferase-like [Ipomoea batatas]
MASSKLHIAMFPWLAYGHIIPFLHLANNLARRGHKISFLLPKKPHLKLSSNSNNNLITFHPLSVPNVEGLPAGAETTSDTDNLPALSSAMDAMQEQVKAVLEAERPDIVVFDYADWMPALAMEVGCKTVFFSVISSVIATLTVETVSSKGRPLTAADFIESVPNFTYSSQPVLSELEAYNRSVFANQPNNKVLEFLRKGVLGAKGSDAMAVRACAEMEGSHCEHLAKQYGKPVFCTGPLLEEEAPMPFLEAKIANWLDKFDDASVVYCGFGSESVLEISQFQELILGLELSGLPFLLASTKPPKGAASIQEAMPEGFQERVKEKAMLHVGWVPQTLILKHKSIGCYVSHGGSASMWESLVSDCQIVVAPIRQDYYVNARLMAQELGVAVQVEKGENGGWLSKENLSTAIKSAMDMDNGESKVGVLVKEKHNKWRDVLLSPGFADTYIHKFIQNLDELLGH